MDGTIACVLLWDVSCGYVTPDCVRDLFEGRGANCKLTSVYYLAKIPVGLYIPMIFRLVGNYNVCLLFVHLLWIEGIQETCRLERNPMFSSMIICLLMLDMSNNV